MTAQEANHAACRLIKATKVFKVRKPLTDTGRRLMVHLHKTCLGFHLKTAGGIRVVRVVHGDHPTVAGHRGPEAQSNIVMAVPWGRERDLEQDLGRMGRVKEVSPTLGSTASAPLGPLLA